MTGCYRDFTADVKSMPVLCINSLITAGEPIDVSVTHTWTYTDVEIIKDKDNYYGGYETRYDNEVTDAIIEIYANNILQTDDYIPQEGDLIRIVATSKKYGRAEGEVTVPVSIPIESLTWNAEIVSAKVGTDFWNEPSFFTVESDLQAKVSLYDPSGIENYYNINCRPEYNDDPDLEPYFSVGSLNYESEPIFSEHIGMIDVVTGNDSYGFTFFTDRQFSGERYTLNLQFENMEIQTSNIPPEVYDFDWSIYFELSAVSKSYYDLVNYEWHAQDGSIADLGNMGLGDPMWGYSNVSSGAGVIAAQSKSTYKINLKDFFISEMEQQKRPIGMKH